ncbi:sulfotransferase [Gloeothece citriformis PCC 7424]|uniref:Sulfotransferase n=1 Tax=Gloeothece citriformis (strain PCC 7424) TaxID=65393 RepID=B7KCX4_GLOC7|nr:sulfotransferase domain-containing protein [Gloeothece citriformis]ACK73095.1 sulfotransferase [Gloeothece citriformis PCC 7424]
MIKQLMKKAVYPVYTFLNSFPDFLMIGVQRSGTTSLYKYLIQHPQILVSHSSRETYYFDNPENYAKGLSWYLKHFPLKVQKGNKLTFEASPSYLYYPYIPKLIHQDLGEIKMIVILRNPVDRAYSAWQMFHSYGELPLAHLRERADIRTFAEAIEQEFNPEINKATYPYNYINRGKYVEQLENYYKYFDKEQILLLSFEELGQDLNSVLNKTCDFLNIEPFSLARIEEFKKDKYAQAKYIKSPDDVEALERLKNYFIPFNEKLYELLGHRYSW